MSDCWYWVGAKHKLGYGLMNAMGECKAHRVSWRLFNGEIPEGLDVLHKCDVRNCVNPDHLFIGTHKDNMRDMIAKGRDNHAHPSGEKNPMAKLTTDLVSQMRQDFNLNPRPYWQIAKDYNISTMTAYRALNNQSWSVAQ